METEVEVVAYVPGHGRQERVGGGGVPDQVAVGAPGGGAAGVEFGPDLLGPPHDHLGGELAVERPGQPGPVVGDVRQVDVDDLPAGVHPASVRPAQVMCGGSLVRAVRSSAWRSAPATDGTSGCTAKPRKAAPS